MHIGFIHPRHPSAEGTGATHSATQIVNGLANAGHDVDVYCVQEPEPGSNTAAFDLYFLSGKSNNPHTNTKINREVSSRIEEFREYDIVHSYMTPLIPSIGELGAQTGVGTVMTLNAYGGVCPKNDLLYLDKKNCSNNAATRCIECILRTSGGHDEYSVPYRIVSRLGDLRLIRQGSKRLQHIGAFRAPSAHVKNNYTELGYPADKISVIPHPIDNQFLMDHESDFSAPFRLLYVGYLEKHKGVDKLVPIVSGLQKKLDQRVELTVVGDGGLRSDLEKQAQEYNVVDAVDLRGFIPNSQLPSIYASHDMFVYPGIWEEPLGRVYLESLATGTPIVTTEYGSIGEIVGEAGELTGGSVECFQRTLLDIINTKDKLPKMSSAAKQRAENFRINHVITQIEEVYERITRK